MQVAVVDYRAADAAERFTQSLKQTGFGVLHQHPIEQALIDVVYAEWKTFFNAPGKEKS